MHGQDVRELEEALCHGSVHHITLKEIWATTSFCCCFFHQFKRLVSW